jgi:hypothetical protein
MITLVTAIPDNPYLLWQVEIQAYNLFQLQGHLNNYYPLVSYTGQHSNYVKELMDKGVPLKLYPDTRTNKNYIPSVQPHILSKFFRENEEQRKEVFYFDADVIFRELPDFTILFNPNDPTWYFSDTVNYIGYKYIITKGQELFDEMTSAVNIAQQLVIENNNYSGGAQHIMKNINVDYFAKVENDSNLLYDVMANHQNGESSIQRWTAGMWSLLWNAFLYADVRLHSELYFNWANTPLTSWDKHKILHMAGATSNLDKTLFYKAEYINKLPFGEDYSTIITANKNCSVKYVELINEYTKVRDTIKYI